MYPKQDNPAVPQRWPPLNGELPEVLVERQDDSPIVLGKLK